jgi:plastocyanin
MTDILKPGILKPGACARRSLLRRAMGVGVVALIGVRARKAAAQEAQVLIDNFVFAPTPLAVSVGDTVKWMNHDDIPHSIVCPALNVKSHTLDTDDSFAHRFERAGTFEYMCGLHPHMRGQVTVKA